MNFFDLLPPVSALAPCGPDPESGGEIAEDWNKFIVGRDAQYNSWSEYRRNKDNPEVRPPDWLPLQNTIYDLCHKTKDLRLAIAFTECLAQTEGLRGLRDGLLLLLDWCATWWTQIHPVAVDRSDFEFRAELIENLNNDRTIKRFHSVPLIELSETRGQRRVITAGPFSLEDYTLAKQPAPANPERAQSVLQTFARGEPAPKEETLACARAARETAQALMNLFQLKGQQLALGKLVDFLKETETALRVSSAPDSAAEAASAEASGVATDAPAAAGGAINSREAASAALDRIAAYFKHAEPSSPVPYFLQRAQRCMGKNYLEIIDELGADRAEVDRVLKPQT